MRDNKPIELEAENYVCSKMAKLDLKYAKPNFDINGGDLLIVNELPNNIYKSITVQVKGRNITDNNSNIRIPKEYINENFILFLYLKIDNDLEDHLFCFFHYDIMSWETKKDDFYLNIPKKSIENNLFDEYKFSKDKINIIFNKINSQKEKHLSDNTEWNLTLIDNNIKLWQKTNCLPDKNLTLWFLHNLNFDYTLLSHDLFMSCLAFIHSSDLETDSAIDWMFFKLKHSIITTEAKITDIKILKSFSNEWLIAYPKSKVDIINLKYNNNCCNGLKLIMGDSEERVECILIDNGDLEIKYFCK